MRPKLLIVLLAGAVVFSGTPVVSSPASGVGLWQALAKLFGGTAEAAQGDPSRRVREIAERRTPVMRVFELANGQTEAEVAARPEHFRDGRGKWHDVDTTIREQTRDGYRFSNDTNGFTSSFGESTDRLARFEAQGGHVALGVDGPVRRVTAKTDGDTVEYDGVFPDARLEYEVTPEALKERVVLAKPPTDATFRFTLTMSGVTSRPRDDGSIGFFSDQPGLADGPPLYVMPKPFMFDGADDRKSPHGKAWSDQVTQTVEKDGDRFTVVVRADREWLNAKERQYPVVIDPTIKLESPHAGQDVQIWSDTPNRNDGASYQLSVGTDPWGAARSLLKFDTGSVPAGATLASAKLRLYYDNELHTDANNVTIEARRVTAAWSEDAATWNTTNAAFAEAGLSTVVKQIGVANTWHEIDVRNIAQSWVSGSTVNHGLMVKAADETLNRGGAIYQGGETAYNGDTPSYPKLVLTYGRSGANLQPITKTYATGAELSWAPYTDPNPGDANDDLAEYQVHRSTSQAFSPSASTLVGTVAAGTTRFVDKTAQPTPDSAPDLGWNAYHYLIAVKTRDGQVAAGPSQMTRVPKAGQVRQVFRGGSDTTLAALKPDANLNALGGQPWLQAGNNGTTYGRARAVVKFDSLDAIPTGTTVVDADLSLWGFYSEGSGAIFDAHPLTKAFVEGEATWNRASAATAWTAAGGDGAAMADSVSGIPNRPTWHIWENAGMAQAWVDNPGANHGVLVKLRDEAGPGQRVLFLSDESGEPLLRPTLEVSYLGAPPSDPPAAPLVSSTDYPADGQPHGVIGKAGTFTFKPGGTAPIAKYSYQLDTDAQATEVAATGEKSVSVTPVRSGTRTLTVRAVNAVGDTSPPTTYSFVVDGPKSGDPHDLFHDAAGRLVGVSQPNGESARYTYDAAGNTLSVARYPSVDLSVFAVVPAQAPVGATVEVSGTAFAADPTANAVSFNGTAGQVVSGDRNRLKVVVPAGVADGPVTVTAAGTSATTTESFRVGPDRPVPTVTGFSPGIGAPGTTVTITGTGFDTDPARDAVRFHRTLAKVTQATPTSLTVVVPDSVSTGKISVRTPGGTATGGADFVIPPSIVAPGDVVDGGPVVIDGASVTTTVPASKALLLRFEGVAGRRIGLGLSANTIGTKSNVRLFDPFGRSFAADQYDAPWPVDARAGFNLALPELTTTGVYQLVVDPETTGTGAITATLSTNVTGATSPTGDGLPFSLTKSGQFADITFEGERETWYDFGFTNATDEFKNVTVTIYEPNGAKFTYLRSMSLGTFSRFKTFHPGTYRLVIGYRDASVGGARLWVSKEVDGGDITTSGGGKTVQLTRPGQQARLRFDGTTGQRLGIGYTNVDLRADNRSYLPGAFVVMPDRSQRTAFGSGYGADVPKLTQTGSHDLLVYGGTATGTVTVWLSEDLDGGTVDVGGDKPISVVRPAQNTRIRFTGTAGQRLSVGHSNQTYVGTVGFKLFNAAGTELASRDTNGLDMPVLPADGTYEIVAGPNAEGLGDFTVLLSAAVDAGTIDVNGAAKNVTVDRMARNASLRFTGTAGQRLSLGITGASSTAFRTHNIRVFRPDGTQLQSSSFINANDSIAFPPLPADGTYEIVDDPDAGGVGTVTFTLSAPADAGAATIGGPALPLDISRAGQDGHLTFTGAAGDRLQLNFSGTTFTTSGFRVSVLRPDGTTLLSPTSRFDQQPVVLAALPVAGTYRVIVDPRLAVTGTTTVGVARVVAAAAMTTPTEQVTRKSTACETPGDQPRVNDGRFRGGVHGLVAEGRREGAPADGWAACGFPRAPADEPAQPIDTVWRPDSDNLAGKGWHTRYGKVPSPRHGPDAPEGTTAVSGQVLAVSGAPLKDVTVSLGKVTAKTDDQGRFLVTGTETGHRVLRVDGRTTPGATHGVFDVSVDVPDGKTLRVPHVVFLPRLDTSTTVKVASPTTSETVLTTQAVPGLEVRIPAGSVIRDADGKVATELSITPIPIDRTPFPLPPTQVPIYFTVQPGSGYLFPAGAQIVYPNYTREAPGTRTMFWNYDPEGQGWHIYGKGTVTPDGKQIVPDPDVKVYRFTGAMTAVPGHNPPPIAPRPGGSRVGDPVDPATGLFVDDSTDLFLDDVVPLELRRTYQQGDQDSRAFGIGMNFNFGHFPWSTGNIGFYRYLEADLIRPDGSRIHFRRITPGETTWEDALFLADPTPTEYDGATMGWNGNGWDIKLTDGTTYVLGDEAPLQAIRDKFGNTTTIKRAPAPADADGKVRLRGPVTQVTSPNGKWMKFTWDNATPPRITKVEDNTGRAVNYTYTADGHLETVTNPAGGVTRYTYEAGRMKTITDPRGITYLTNTYDGVGRVAQQTAADGGVTKFDYVTGTDGAVVETKVTDPKTAVTRFKFNAKGLPTEVTGALGTAVERTSRTEYDPTGGRPVASVDALGRRTEVEYNDRSEIVKRTVMAGTPSSRSETFERDGPFGELTAHTDHYGNVTRTTYDARGAALSTKDTLGKETKYTTSDSGQVTSVTDPLGKTTTMTQEFGEQTAVTDPLGRTHRALYDSGGRKVEAIDPLGNRTTTTYDVLDLVRTVTDPLGRTVRFDYDANGNRTKVVDQRSGATNYTYNPMDQLETATDPLGKVERFDYDRNLNLAQSTARGGRVTTFEYDQLNRNTKTRFGVSGTTDQGSITLGYDTGDRVVRKDDTAAGVTTQEFDLFDRLTAQTTAQGTVGYTYTATDNNHTVRFNGQSIEYLSDTEGGLRTVRKGGADVVRVERDELGRPTRSGAPGDGVHTDHEYDEAGQVKAVVYRHGDRELGRLTYEYDRTGMPVRVGGTYARTSVPAASGPSTYDAGNRLTNAGGTPVTYDLDGNMVNDGARTYTWNARGQLAGISGSGVSASFAYDSGGRRTSRTVGGVTTTFLHDGMNPVQETVNGATTTFVNAGTDELLLRESGGTTSRFLTDPLGSVVALADDTGALSAEYAYEPYGKATVDGDDKGNTRRFAGREDDGTGLHHNRARYYSPTLQRFVSEDPTGFNGGYNLHAYAANRPTVLVDPTGAKPSSPGGVNNPPSRGMTGAQPGQNGVTRKDLSGSSGRIADELARRGNSSLGRGVPVQSIVDASRYLGKEIGIVQNSQTGQLRAVIGKETTVSFGRLGPNEHVLAHTHPVYKTERTHFGTDLRAAHPDRVEAVIDWSGAVTYYKQGAFVNAPPKPMINEYGYLVGYRP